MALNFFLKRSGTASKRPDAVNMAFGEIDLNYNAGTGGLFYRDSANSVVKIGPAQISTTAPNATPAGSAGNSAGEFWLDTSLPGRILKLWDGTAWQQVSLPTDTAGEVISVTFADSTVVNSISNSTSTTSSTTAASSTAVKAAYDLAVSAGGTAGAALPLAGGTMTGDITFDPSEIYANLGITFQDTSKIQAISDSTSTTSSTTAASSTAVKSAYDLADAALPLAGGSMSGDIQLFSQVPTNSSEPASKYYADQIAAGFRPQTAVAAATAVALSGVVTYNNGTAGVGATLTLNTPITTIDGVTITTVGTRVLIKNQVSTLQNGVYTYTSGGATTVLTRATDADEASELLSGNAYFVNAGTVNANNTLVQIPTVATVGTSPITYTLSSVKPFHKYSLEWNVDPVGGDDTNGTGGDQQPYKTIAKALISAGNIGSRIILHQGTYTENLTIPNLNLEIVGATRSGATINGTIAFTAASSSVRVYGVQFGGNLTHSGAGGVYTQSGTFAPGISLTKSGSGYLEMDDMAGDSSTVTVTGAGYVNYFNSRIGGLTVNNAAAFVTLQDMSLVGPTTVTAGVFQVNHANYFAATESGNAITAASGTTVPLRNVNFYTPAGAVARVSLAGNYSFNDVVVDRTNSTLGTNLGAIARFDALDTFGPVYANGAAGTAGQILTSAGAGAAPTWCNAAATPTASPTVAGLILGCATATNSALGCNALNSITSGNGNVALGTSALGLTTTAPFSTAVGSCALCASTGSTNTALGALSGKNITTGFLNVIVGANVDAPSATGSCQLAIGYDATCYWLTGCSNLNIKPGAGIVDCAGSAGTAGQALLSTGGNNVVWGSSSPAATVTAAGAVLGCTNVTNAYLGCNAGVSVLGTCNTFLGSGAACTVSSGNCNVVIGAGVQPLNAAAGCQLAIGAGSICWLTGTASGAIKPMKGIIDCGNSCGSAGQALLSNGANGVCWGAVTPSAATPTVAGIVLGCTNATNAALGCNALRSLTSGAGNVAIGINAGCSTVTGVNNVFVGNGAGLANTVSGNVAIGTSALLNNTTAGRNTAVGEQASQSNVLGEYNAAFGWAALQNSTGGCNTALGGVAGQSITTGTYNVAIGANVQVAAGNASCQLAIGWEGCRWITGDSGKNLCVYNAFVIKPGGGAGPTGVAANDSYFYADGSNGAVLSMGNTFGNGKDYTTFRNPSNVVIGSIRQVSNSSISYVTTSDYRLKENVKNLEGATEVLRALPVYEYNFISEPEVVHQGFLAHELQEFVPLAVTGTKDEVDEEGNAKYQGVDASKVVPLLVAALKESIARIDALEAEVKELKSNT